MKVFESYRLLQTVLFLTDSVFRVLFAYFDASMDSIGGYEKIEKLEYSRFNTNINKELVHYSTLCGGFSFLH